MKVINLFAGPGSGKSTTAAGLFHLMKLQGLRVELVTEFAKDLHYEGARKVMSRCQGYITGNQLWRLERLRDECDWVVTDSPLPLGILYKGAGYGKSYDDFVMSMFHNFDNTNFYLVREKPFHAYGRSQTPDEAVKLDGKAHDLLDQYGINFLRVQGNEEAPQKILEVINARHST